MVGLELGRMVVIAAGRSRRIRAAVLEVAPDAYRVAGVGWCGPGWRLAEVVDAAAREVVDSAVRGASQGHRSKAGER